MEENKKAGLYSVQQENEAGSSFDFKTIYTMIILNWQWLVLSLIICLGLAVVYLRYATPIYQADVKLLIKDDPNSSRSSAAAKNQMLMSTTLGIMSNSAGIDNEMVILGSKSLASETVKDLKLYVSYYMSAPVKDKIVYKTQPINIDLDAYGQANLKKPIKLTVDYAKGEYHIKGTYTYVPADNEKKPIKYTIDRTTKTLPFSIRTSVGTISFNANPGHIMPEDRTLTAVIVSPEDAGAAYAKAMSVSQTSKTTTIAEMVINDAVPERATDYLKQLVVCYNRQANIDKNEIAMRTEQFINTRLEKINNELGATEGNLESTKRRYGIIDPKINSAQTVANSDMYTQKLVEANTQIELLRSINEYMNEPANKYQALPSNVGLSDPAASALITKYNEIAMERNRLLRSASETSPSVTPLTAQLEDLASSIRRAMSQAQRNTEIQRNNIQQQYSVYTGQISSTPEQERILTQIGRQQEVKSGLYLMLLQKREENSISLAATADKGKIIDNPLVKGKISPKAPIILLIALILGIALPIGLVYLVEMLRYKIEGHDDVEKLTKLPIIGDVAIASSTAKTKADIVVHENTNNVMEEIFRSIRSNVQFMLKEGEKVIMFTSTTSGEGKTFTAANLAVSFALLGKKVVLVGLDIRKPRLAQLFEINDFKHGITPLLMRQSPTKEDLKSQILKSGVNNNLDLLMAGPIPPNPAELVNNKSLDIVIDQLKEEYDYVFIDTAPVGLVTDTLQIGRVANLTIYMCRADYTAKSSFDLINSLANEKKLPNVSVVINGIDMSKKKYGYSYGYGKYGKYGRYGKYGKYGSYGTYGSYSESHYGNKDDDSIKK